MAASELPLPAAPLTAQTGVTCVIKQRIEHHLPQCSVDYHGSLCNNYCLPSP